MPLSCLEIIQEMIGERQVIPAVGTTDSIMLPLGKNKCLARSSLCKHRSQNTVMAWDLDFQVQLKLKPELQTAPNTRFHYFWILSIIPVISVNLSEALCTGLVGASIKLKRNEKRCKQTALCPPEANKALLWCGEKELQGGSRASQQNKNSARQSTKKSISRLFLESTSSFETSMAINLHDTYFRGFFFLIIKYFICSKSSSQQLWAPLHFTPANNNQ